MAFLYQIIDVIFQILYLALIIRVLLSWIPHNQYHPLINMLYSFTDPILRPFQKLIPTGAMGIDISPIFAFIALGIVRKIIESILFQFV